MREQRELTIPYLGEKARYVTYDNGYTFVFVPKRNEVFNLSTWVRTGSIHEDDQNNGVSHFLEHLMFKGTDRFAPGEFDRSMEGMGAIINAATWKDFTFYYVTGPQDAEGKNFDKALDMHADMMIHSTLPEAEIGPQYNPDDPDYQGEKRERSVVIEEIGMRLDQPWTKVYNALNHMMYPEGHPYQRDVIGTPQIIGNIPRTAIQDYYNTWYAPGTFTTIVVGDFDADVLEEKVLGAFNFPADVQVPASPSPDPVSANGASHHRVIEGEYQTSFFIFGYHGPNPRDFKDSIALDAVSCVLGESRSARFTQELIEKPENPVFNAVGCSQSLFSLGNVFYVQGNFNSPDADGCLAQVKTEIQKVLTTHPITRDELERAKKKLKVDYAETSETASGIGETIGESVTVIGDIGYYLNYLDVLNGLTVDMVNAVAKKYLSEDQLYSTVLVPQQNGSAT